MNKLLTLFFILLFSSFVFSQANKKSEIKKIDKYCKSVDFFVKRHKKPQLIFADISQTEKEKWRKFSSEKTLEKFRENTETYSIAYNWINNRKTNFANFTNFSESGDWANYVSYYFRPNGKLAKIESRYRTFYGHFAAEQNIYFDLKGKVIKRWIQYFDLESMKPIKTPKEWLPDNLDNMNDFNFYKTITKLPFASLLKN